jgi:hypothetical protein
MTATTTAAGCSVVDEHAGLIRTTLARVLALADPLASDPWGVGAITHTHVQACLDAGHTAGAAGPHDCARGDTPRDQSDGLDLGPWCHPCEVASIARWVTAGLPENDAHPVTLDFGFGWFVPEWMLVDGNHRVAAATLRGDAHLVVAVHGDWDHAVRVLVDGVDFNEEVAS